MLSKSRYLAGLQCAKRLWMETREPGSVPAYDAATLRIFDQGREVGRLAQGLFPGGIEIERAALREEEAVTATRQALARRRPIYEAAFVHAGAVCFSDLLVPVGDEAWNLLEVKAKTATEPEHLDDVAFQAWILREAGVRLHRLFVAHLDNTYVRSGALDLERLFVRDDVTEAVERLLPDLPGRVERLLGIQSLAAVPQVTIGPHCRKPHDCRLRPVCESFLPRESVLTLYKDAKRKWDLLARGVLELSAVPDHVELTGRQAIQRATARSKSAHVDVQALRQFLATLVYPIHFFDLESYQFAIPPFDGARPQQQIPFQYSLHRIDAPGTPPRQRSFLAEGLEDPRGAFMDSLSRAIDETGSIVVYHAQFERSCLREAAEHLPQYVEWVEGALARVVDLLEPFRKFSYYHPKQLGSASLKKVLPILAGRGYEELEIQEGQSAAREFLRSLSPGVSPDERERIRRALLDYCARDTEGMIEVVAALDRLAGG